MGADLHLEFQREKNPICREQLLFDLENLSDIAYELDVTPLEEMISIGEDEVELAAAAENMTPAAVRKKMVKWFDADEALASMRALSGYLKKKKDVIRNQEVALRQLEFLAPLLQEAKQQGVKVRLRYFL
jgi:hypothetical protein